MKVLIIGLGAIGQRHLRNLRALLPDDAEFLAYRVRRKPEAITATLQVDATRDVENEYRIRTFSDLDEALAEAPKIAVISNPSSMHIQVALDCARAGCDLFLEKPLSNNMAGISDLQSELKRRSLIAMVGYQLRFHPCFLHMQEILSKGMLGRLLCVRATVGEYLPGWHPYEDYRQGYAARSELGGGVVLTLIHEFDYLYALFGRVHRVYSVGGHFSNLEMDVEDVASTLMECEADGRPLPVHLQQDYLQCPPSRNCEVIGDAGKAMLDFRSLEVMRYNAAGEIVDHFRCGNFDRNQLFVEEMQHFLDSVGTRSKPIVDVSEGLWSLKLAIAARESMATHKVVEIA
ncbi:MAG: Gfo/Idh/MocA family oxidoreductase [Candidatus Korobacteraceae bacterium]